MNIISRSLGSSFNCFVRQSTTRGLLTREFLNGFQPRYFSHTTQPHSSLRPRSFYEIPPSPRIYVRVAAKEKELYQNLSEGLSITREDRYSKSNGLFRSWLARLLDPSKFWEVMISKPKLGNQLNGSLLSFSAETSLSHCLEVLKQEGGRGLKNISQAGLTVVWDKFKEYKADDEIVELFHCRLPSNFTASPEILLDYCFAQLRSSYCQPLLVTKIAENLLKQKPLAQAHYVRGLAHMVRACVAKDLHDLLQQGKKDAALEDRYREYFNFAVYEDSSKNYKEALTLAEVEFKQAFKMQSTGQHALAGILNLIEQGHLEEARTWSTFIWQQLQEQPSRTTQDLQALLIAGIITQQSSIELEQMTKVMLAEEPGLKTEYLENLQLLAPHFSNTHQMIKFLSLPPSEKV